MSEKLIRPYEISVWEDKLVQDGNETKFVENKLAVIGSDTMTGLNKVYNPVFNKKSNGERTLSFSLKYKYFDPYTGNEDMINPFAALLVNERKVKLHYDNQWYEFIVKDHTESSEEYEWTYTCNDAFVLELSKQGYNITFDTELNNNQGTAEYLVEETIKETDWRVGDINAGKQYVAEPIYKAILYSTNYVNIMNVDKNIPASFENESLIYLFYSYVKNQDGNFIQFIIRDSERQYTIDSKNIITDINFRITTDLLYKENQYIEITNIEPSDDPRAEGWYELNDGTYILSDDDVVDNEKTYYKKIRGFYYNNQGNDILIIEVAEIETLYQANRLVYKQETTYDPVMERTVDCFKVQNGDREIYKYVDNIYSTSNVLTNYITNGNNFNMLEDGTLQGWNPYVGPAGTDGATINKLELVTKPELKVGQTLENLLTLSEIEGYLHVKFNGTKTVDYKNLVYNSGFKNNASIIGSVASGQKFVFRWRARKGSVTSDVPATGLRVLVAKYTQDTPTPYQYYFKHIDSNNIVLDFSGEPQIKNNIITNGVLKIAYRLTNDKTIVSGKTYYTRSGDVYNVVVSPTVENLSFYYEQYYNYVVDNVVQTPSTKYIYINISSEDAPEGEYLWDGANQTYIPRSQGSYLPYYYLVADAQRTVPNSVLSDPSQKYGIFIYNIEGNVEYFIQDIQLTQFVADGDSNEPVLIGNIPTATAKSNDYYYLKPSEGDTKEDIKTYTSLQALKDDLDISETIVPIYNEKSEKVLTISASQSNCFNILQTIAETFECWVDLNVEHDNNGYILYDESNLPKKYINLREYIGKDNWAGFKYGINLQSIERNINSEEVVTKLIVDQSQSEYVDEGYVSITNAPSNISGESYILNFDYYYSQNLLDRDVVEPDRLNFITEIASINKQLQEVEEKRRNYSKSYTKLKSDRNVYTELIATAQDNKTAALEDFKSLTGLDYITYQSKQAEAIKSGDSYYILTDDKTVIDDKAYYTKSGDIFNIVEIPTGNPKSKGWYEILLNVTDEDTLLDIVGELYINSVYINNYSGLLTNVEQEYQKVKKDLYGLDDYSVTTWVDVDSSNMRHIYVELNDYLIGFNSKISESDNIVNVSKKFFDISPTDATSIIFCPPTGYKIVVDDVEQEGNYEYIINDSATATFGIHSINTVEGIVDIADGLIEEKNQLIKDFNNKYSHFIQEGTWNSTDYIDAELYYLNALQVSNTSAQPTVSYTISVVEISQLENFEAYEFDAGDKSYVEDTEFFGWSNINVGTEENPNYILTPAREEVIVSEVEWHLEEPDQNTITVQNYKTRFEDLFQRIDATVQTVQYNEATYAKISSLLDANGTINQNVLVNSLNNLSGREYALTSNGSIIVEDDRILVQNLTNPANRVMINSEGIRISSDGGENWTTAIDGQGINIGTVYTGSLNTNEVIIGSRENPSFRWDKAGISAYKFNENSEDNLYDLQTFVRFDQYGLYGIKNNGDFRAESLEDIKNKAHFAVTWDGFFIKNSYEGGGRVEITSDNDFRILNTVSNQENEKIKIGALEWEDANGHTTTDPAQGVGAPTLYGIRIKNDNGDEVMKTDDEGNLTIIGTIEALGGNFKDLVTVGKPDNPTASDAWIEIDGRNENAIIKSSNYSNSFGWMINKDGDAVFNNITARGAIKTAVFEYAEIQAVGGVFIFRPSSTIKSARLGDASLEESTNDIIVTVENPILFKNDQWCKVSNYASGNNDPDVIDPQTQTILQNNGLIHVYQVSRTSGSNEITLLGAAAMINGADAVISSADELIGGALIDMGNQDGTANYGIGVNSSDNTVNLPARAISLFETTVNGSQNPKISYNYRGILGTLPPMSSGVNASIYSNMEGTQGIYTDNMYIGDARQYIAFYSDNEEEEEESKKLAIRAKEISFENDKKQIISNGNGLMITNSDKDGVEGYGYNTILGGDYLSLRYDTKDLIKLDENGMAFYDLNDVLDNPSAILNNQGLILKKGGIIVGIPGEDNSVYLSSEDYGAEIPLVSSNKYELTSDISIDNNKTYYILSEGEYVVVNEPNVENIDTYYERTTEIEKTDWKQIIGSKFAVDSKGVLYASDAVINGDINANSFVVYREDNKIASFGEEVNVGDTSKFHIAITPERLSFYENETNEVAYIDGDKLYITKSVVLQQMDLGRPQGEEDGLGQWSWKVHEVNGKNNMYLKWIG